MDTLERALLSISRKSKYKKLMERLANSYAADSIATPQDRDALWYSPEILQLRQEGYTQQQIFEGMKVVLMDVRIRSQESV